MIRQPLVEAIVQPTDIEATYPVVAQLRPHLTAGDYVTRVTRMMAAGFRMAAIRSEGSVVAVAGYHVGESLSWGRYLYVDDLVTGAAARSSGHGKALLDWLKAEARSQGCVQLHLDSGVARHGAHRFYLRERMDIIAYHFEVALG